MPNIELDIPDTKVVVREPSVIVDRSKLPIQSVAEFALTASYANYAKNVDAFNIGIVGNISASGAITASNLYAANSLISSGTVAVYGNIGASGIVSASGFSGSFVGDGSQLTGLVTVLRLSGSTSGNDELSLSTDTLSISGSNGISVRVLNNKIIIDAPNNTVSSSAQIDHDSTINYTASKHIDHSAVSILAGSGLSGGGNISSTRILAIDTGSSHFTGGVTTAINALGIISSSNQVDVRNTTGITTLANTGSNTFKGTQTVQGNIFLSSSFPLVYNNNNTNNMLFGFFDGSQIHGAYYQTFGNNYSNVSQRGGAEVVYDTRNGGDANFHVASFDGSTWIQRFRVDNGGIQVTGSINATAGITGSFRGDGSQLTGIATVLAISGSTVGSDLVNLKSDSLKFSGSNGITAVVTDNTITFTAPSGTVTGSIQVDHNSTANYTASRHIDHGVVFITAGNGLSGGGDISSTRILSLDTASTHFAGGVTSILNSRGIISSSTQVSYLGLINIPTGILSSSAQISNYNIFTTTGSNRFQGDQIITGSLTVAQNLIVLGSSSVNFVSQSTLNIGTNLITVNVQNPSVRLGGLAVIDSGSFPQRSGSLLFDSINDQWIFVHQNVAGGVTSSILVMGPPTFNNVGNETLLTQNRILKGGGLEHIVDSQITDDGNTVSIINALSVGTSVTASSANIATLRATSISASFISGALSGTFPYINLLNVPVGLVSSSIQAVSWSVATASLATTASAATSITFIPVTASFAATASYALNALGNQSASWASQSISSSYAITASYALNSIGGQTNSASYAETASYSVTASYLLGGTFPPAYIFDGGTPSSSFTVGPIFDCGGVI